MINNSLNKWRGGSRSLFKNLFIGYLALVTGCTTTVQEVGQAPAIEQSQAASYTYQEAPADNQSASIEQGNDNPYNLPELAGAVPNDEPPSSKGDALSEFVGGLPASEQQTIADPRNNGYQGANEFGTMAMGMLNSAATQNIKQWFTARHATAEVAFNAGSKGGKSGSFDMLMPIFDGEKDLVFTQVGVRRSNTRTEDYRNTINLGVGYRRSFDNWLAGINGFYDRDMTGKNNRLGIGAEAFTDNIRASANVYIRASEWKESPDLEDYLERPANGYDLRVEGNLPSLPQVVGKAVYEKYFGDQVGLFGSSNRQKDPQAVTLGVTYSPVPMIGLGVDYRQGQGGLSETSAKMTINYQFGVPLAKQLSMAYSTNHKLINSRYGLVNRNNEIVLDYREKDAGQIMLPPEIHGTPALNISFPVTLTDSTIGQITWTGTAAAFALPYGGGPTAAIVLPAFNPGGINTYTLQAIGTDRFGRVIQSNVMQVRVEAFIISIARSKATGLADGTDAVTFTATLLAPTGLAMANSQVDWDVQGSATVTEKELATDSKGLARLKLVSHSANSVKVSVREPQGAQAETNANFTGDPATARVVSLIANPTSITADGSSASTIVATIEDVTNNRVGAGVPVNWMTTGGTLSGMSSVTDENGQAFITLTSPTVIGIGTVTATAKAGAATVNVAFKADVGTARILNLVATPTTIKANGADSSTLVATIVDANNNNVGFGVPVSWVTSAGTLASSSSITNAGGKATMVLTSSTVVDVANVTATTAAGSANAAVNFAPDESTARVIALVATPPSILANGIEQSTLVATLQDAHGNPMGANVPVSFTTTGGLLSSSTGVTNASGKATITVTGTVAGNITVTASAAAGSSSTNVALTADTSTARVLSLIATPSTIVANGSDQSVLVATIQDAHGNPVGSGVNISWSSTGGSLSGSSSVTDSSSRATITLTSSYKAESVNVTAIAATGSASAPVTFVADSSMARVLNLTASPTTITANGVDTSTIVATVEDTHGNPMGPNVPVSWTTTSGSLASATTLTDSAGKARVVLTSASSMGLATVTGTASVGSANTTVSFVADPATARIVALTANPTTIVADGVETSTFVATVEDASGNPMPAGVTVSWSTTRGTLASSSTVTAGNGKATVTLKGTVAGVATVTASAVQGSANASVTLIADVTTAQVVSVTASPAAVYANGTISTLSATVRDAYGNVLPAGQAVHWATTLNSLNTGLSYTDASGKAVATISGVTVGTAVISARTDVSSNATTNVTFTNPKPTILSFTEAGEYANKMIPNQLSFSTSGQTYASNVFNWSAINGQRYELVDQDGRIMYSGSGTSTNINGKLLSGNWGNTTTWSLRAYNGATVTVTYITLNLFDLDPPISGT